MSMMKRSLAILLGVAIILIATTATAQSRSQAVAPTLEIAVLDPNVDPLGRPTIKLKEGAVKDRMEVDIPETVIVHRYYYTGDRSFQAQFLPGGPCIVVVNHPRCGERLYVPVQMIPGSPRVHYTSHAIEYDYGRQGITIRFCLLTKRPKVEYRNGMTVARHIENHHTKVNKACKEFADRTGLTEAKQTVASAAKNACKDTADAIGAIGKVIMLPVNQIGQLIPGAQMFGTSDEDRATRLRNAQVQAAEKAAANQNLTIPSNR